MPDGKMGTMRNICIMIALVSTVLMTSACDMPPTATPGPATVTLTATATVTETVTRTPSATPTATPRATATCPACATCAPIDASLWGNILGHAWVDTDDNGAWDFGEPGVVVTQAIIYQGSIPAGMALYPSYQLVTSDRGLAVNAQALPGGYVIVLLRYEGCFVPYYDNYEFLTVNSGETATIRTRFWRDLRCTTPLPTVTPTATKTPGPTATPTAIVLHQCPNYWTNCIDVKDVCPIGTAPDVWGECGAGFRCCVPVTP